MIDLHTHTTASDGILKPTDLVQYAFSKGVTTLAITDHDTTEGLDEGVKEAEKLGMGFIPGIEINVNWPTGEFHLLGYGLYKISTQMTDLVSFRREQRKERNLKIVGKMQADGFKVEYDDILEGVEAKGIGRPHFASYMVQKGIAKNRQVAFDKYLAKGRPWYVPQTSVDLEVALEAIKSCGGVPVIAHPLSLYVSWGKITPVIENLYERGVEGLEAWHPGVRAVEAKRLEDLAREVGMFVTAGSDFHGKLVRPDREIGHTTSSQLPIEDRFWTDELSVRLKKS